MKERCGRKWPQRSFWCSLGERWGWDHKPKQLNNQRRGQHRRLGNAHSARDDLVETSCRGWGCKQSRPLPRAVRAASLCPRCPHRWGASCKYGGKENRSDYCNDYKRQKSEFQIFIATIVATTKGKKSNFEPA